MCSPLGAWETGDPSATLGPRQREPELRGQVRMKYLLRYYTGKYTEPTGSLQGMPGTSFHRSYQKQVPGVKENEHLEGWRKPSTWVFKSGWGCKATASLVLISEGNKAASPSCLQIAANGG